MVDEVNAVVVEVVVEVVGTSDVAEVVLDVEVLPPIGPTPLPLLVVVAVVAVVAELAELAVVEVEPPMGPTPLP